MWFYVPKIVIIHVNIKQIFVTVSNNSTNDYLLTPFKVAVKLLLQAEELIWKYTL